VKDRSGYECAPLTPQAGAIRARLVSLATRLQLLAFSRAVCGWLILAAALVILVLLALRTGPLPVAARNGLLAYVVTVAALALLGVVAWALTQGGLRRAAVGLEREFPHLQDRLLAGLEVTGRPSPYRSLALADALARQVEAELSSLPLGRVLHIERLRGPVLLAGAAIALTALVWALCPGSLANLSASVAPTQIPPISAPVTRPPAFRLTGLTVIVAPPAYSGLPRRELVAGYEKLQVLKGSRLTVQATASAAGHVSLVYDGQQLTQASLGQGEPAELNFKVAKGGEWRVTATSSGQSAEAGPYRLIVSEDEPPHVEFLLPGHDLTLEQLSPVDLQVGAWDDFSVAHLSLQYRLAGASAWQSLSLGGGAKLLQESRRWDLAPLRLPAGQVMEYRAVATDNDAVSGPKTTVTKVFTISYQPASTGLPPTERMAEAAAQEQDALEKLQQYARELDETLTKMLQQLDAGELTVQSQAELRSAIAEGQRRLEQSAEGLRQAMEQARQNLQAEGLLDDELIDKVLELHRLLDEVLDDEMKQALRELQQALDKLDLEKLRLNLEQAREAHQRLMRKLDQTLELLRRARMEIQLQALADFIKRLADEQEQLAARTGAMSEQDRQAQREARNQGDLARRAAELPGLMQGTAEQLRQQEPAAARELEQAAAQVQHDDPAGLMRQAAQALKRLSPRAAQQPQQQALQALRQAQAAVADAQAMMLEQMRQELMAAAQQFTRDALALSQQQEQLIRETEPLAEVPQRELMLTKRQAARLQREQQAIQEGAIALAARLAELASQTPLMNPELAAQTSRIAGDMAQVSREIAAGTVPQALTCEHRAMRELNALAQRLLEMSGDLSQASAQMALSEYLKRLEALAQRQRGLNQQTGQQMSSEGTRLPLPGAQPSLSDLAQEQALIRQALERMLKGQGAGEFADQLGNVPGQMEDVEADLQGGQIRRRTIEQQREILHKMLDAQRSLYTKRQQQRKRRVAERPKPFTPTPSPPRLLPSQLKPPQREIPDRQMSPAELPLGYEELVEQYFEALQQE